MTDKARVIVLLAYLETQTDKQRYLTRADISSFYESMGFSGNFSTIRSDIAALQEAKVPLIERIEHPRNGGILYTYRIVEPFAEHMLQEYSHRTGRYE